MAKAYYVAAREQQEIEAEAVILNEVKDPTKTEGSHELTRVINELVRGPSLRSG